MRLLHSVRYTPRLCGLYETARDLMAGELALGHEVRMYDPLEPAPNPPDRGCESTTDATWGEVIIDHSGCDKALLESGKPIIHMRHGRPRATYLMEAGGGPKAFSHVANMGQRYAAICTFWPEHRHAWECLTGRDVHVIDAPVDLDAWTPDGPSGYQFGGKRADYNAVCTDVWRDDCDPLDAIFDWWRVASGVLHLYGIQQHNTALTTLLRRLDEDGRLGEVKPWVQGLDNVYRAADTLVTGAVIATRAVREAMACGLSPFRNPKFSTDKPRRDAVRDFNPKNAAGRLLGIVDYALKAA